MSILPPDANEVPPRLQEIVVAFDIDNTLTLPDGLAYRRAVSEFMEFVDLGIGPAERFDAYEAVRAQGNALERIGLTSPIHFRGHADALAVLCLTSCGSAALLHDLDIKPDDQPGYRAFFAQLASLEQATAHGKPEVRLEAEIALRRFLATDARVEPFHTEAKRIGQHPLITRWAEAYPTIEDRHQTGDYLPLMKTLAGFGVTTIVISEGRSDVQIEKLRRLGLADFFEGRVLVSQDAANVVGIDQLEQEVSNSIDSRIQSTARPPDDELELLWYYRCLINTWATKSPSFYARCLHAIRQDPRRPEEALRRFAIVKPQQWRQQPLRFVMVGDRYDKDVLPLIELLGPGCGMKLHLTGGKYDHLNPKEGLPADRHPDRTFSDWDLLSRFLTDELAIDQIEPITTGPDIVERSAVKPEMIERGLASQHEAVRVVAEAIRSAPRTNWPAQ